MPERRPPPTHLRKAAAVHQPIAKADPATRKLFHEDAVQFGLVGVPVTAEGMERQ